VSSAYEQATSTEMRDALRALRRGDDSGEWEIGIVSHEVALGAVHHEIVFLLPNGKMFMGMNGQAFDRETGESDNFTIQPNKSLRVSASVYKATDGEYTTATLMRGSGEEVLQKLGQAVEAAHFINESNLTYVPVDPITCSQNSNSVATSILHAMGLEYPPEIEELWAPGECRDLLPEHWESHYDYTTDRHLYHLKEAVEALGKKAIAEDVINDPPADPNVYPYQPSEPDIPIYQ